MKEDRDGWIEEICDIALKGHFLYLFYLLPHVTFTFHYQSIN